MPAPIYVATNRRLNSKKQGLDLFGKEPNPKGPNELRLVKVEDNGGWQAAELKDKLTQARVRELKQAFNLDIDVSQQWFASLEVACELFDRARTENKSILFFVHGYNNDIEDILNTVVALQEAYDVIVLPFSWPANGGGAISGTASYLSDKSDARVSTGALNRIVEKISDFHRMLTMAQNAELQARARDRFPDNNEAAFAYFSELVERVCQVRLSMLCHSMGNYVLKHTLKSSDNQTSKLVFDNICLVAADTNNADHEVWVDDMDVRSRLYIVINEKDYALKASRIKPGNEQRARLGHYLKNLNSRQARYIDVTGEDAVGNDHGYFKGDALANQKLKDMFSLLFTGDTAENLLTYQADINCYRLS